MSRMVRSLAVSVSCLVLASLFLVTPAVAKNDGTHGNSGKVKAPVTKIDFHLDDHNMAVGEFITADVVVSTQAKPGWAPLAGVTLSVTEDGVEVTTLTTDATGHAALSVPATVEGVHVVRVIFAGDPLHKKAQRAQGIEVTPAVVVPPVEPPAV